MRRSSFVVVLGAVGVALALARSGPAEESGGLAGGAAAVPAGVSPGAVDAFLAAPACPTFSWTAAAGAYEILVYRAEADALEPPVLRQRLPAGAQSWTPAADRCLEPGGRYAWSVRAVPGEWSEALLFAVPAPAAMDLERALGVLREALEADPQRAAELLGELAASPGTGSAEAPAGDAIGAEAVPEGVEGPINADTLDFLDSTQFLRSDIGGTLTGPLIVDPAAGTAIVTGSGDDIDLGGSLRKSGTLFLHNLGTANLALGADALLDVTTGANNLAVGANALDANTTGGNNTALGNSALGANVTGSSNVAVGRNALLVNTASNNVGVGAAALDANTTGTSNTAVGNNALGANLTGTLNTAVGRNALLASTASGNTGLGAAAADATTSGGNNTAVGTNALGANVTGANNTALGASALLLATGSNNLALGNGAGAAATTGSNDIYLGHAGVPGESNTTRLGTPGTQTATFVAGVHGASPAGATQTVVINASGQLGSTPGGGGSGLNADTLDGIDSTGFMAAGADFWVNATGDVMSGTLTLAPAAGAALTTTAGDLALHGTATITKAGARFLWDHAAYASFSAGRLALANNSSGHDNTAVGAQAMFSNTTGGDNTAVGYRALHDNTSAYRNTGIGALALEENTTGFSNVAVGYRALRTNESGYGNTAAGARALPSNTSGLLNTAVGYGSLYANTDGYRNTAAGASALASNTTGSRNTALGHDALALNTTGQRNIAIGYGGGALATGSDNILLGHGGVAAENGTIRIGTSGSHTTAFLAGVHGVTTGGPAVPVVIDAAGQLGTVSGAGGEFEADTLGLAPRSAAPACGAAEAGRVYFDSEDATFCFCEGRSGWRPLDGAGACT